MDEIGLSSTTSTTRPDLLQRHRRPRQRIPVGQRVWVGERRSSGIIGRKPVHLLEEEERKKKPELKDLWVDVGASSKEEAEAVIGLGDVITFQYEFEMLMGDRATARGSTTRWVRSSWPRR